MDSTQFKASGNDMINYIVDYLDNVEHRRVTPDVRPGYLRELMPGSAPQDPESFDDIMRDVEDKIMVGMTHWQHPRFHAYFSSGNSYPSILADMLSDAIGCIGFSWAAGPSCTELETIMLDWMGQMLGLPGSFLSNTEGSLGGGVIQSSASECILDALLAARANAVKTIKAQHGDMEDTEILSKLVAYCSKEAHSCVEKDSMIGFVKIRSTSGTIAGWPSCLNPRYSRTQGSGWLMTSRWAWCASSWWDQMSSTESSWIPLMIQVASTWFPPT